MPYVISYYSDKIQEEIANLPKTMVAKYFKLADRMEIFGPDLGMPHSRAMGDGVFELRIMGAEGIARVFLLHHSRLPYCDAALLYQENQPDAAQ